MKQASHEVQAQGRKADIVCEAPLLHSALTSTAPSLSLLPGSHRAAPPALAAAGALHHRAGSGRQAAHSRGWDALSRQEKHFFPLW